MKEKEETRGKGKGSKRRNATDRSERKQISTKIS